MRGLLGHDNARVPSLEPGATRPPCASTWWPRWSAPDRRQVADSLASHGERELAQPAFLPAGIGRNFQGEFGRESEENRMQVVLDPARSLSPGEPARMMLTMGDQRFADAGRPTG